MRIAILGSGGVGGYFGGRLAAAGGSEVHFIARGAHLDALRTRGLRIDSPAGPIVVPKVEATDDPATIGPVDVVFFAVKLYDTESAIAMLPPLIGPRTIVVPFQNGVDSVDRLVKAIGRDHVAGGTTYVTATIAEPGVIRHTALDRLVFGPIAGDPPPALRELHALTTRAGIEGVLAEKIHTEIWKKFVRLSVFSGITSLLRSPIGPIREDPELREILETALHETIAVGRGKQIPLPHSMYQEAIDGLDAMPRHAKSSMLQDLERGHRLELPWLSGGVVRIGREVGVPTPTHEMFVRMLRLHANGTPQ